MFAADYPHEQSQLWFRHAGAFEETEMPIRNSIVCGLTRMPLPPKFILTPLARTDHTALLDV